MLANDRYSVDAGDCLGHRITNTDPMLCRLFPSHVIEWKLIDVEGDGLNVRCMPPSVQTVAVEQAAEEDICVRIRRVNVENARDARTTSGRLRECAASREREPVSPCQNAIFNPNWNCRDVLACRVTVPNCCDVTAPFGAANCGVLNRL